MSAPADGARPAAVAGRPPRLVTVDGPAGSGKTTLGRRLALALGVPLVDTGLLYRAVTVMAARASIAADDVDGLTSLAAGLAIDVDTAPTADPPAVRAAGVDLTDALYDPGLAPLLSAVSRTPGVRAALLAPQRGLAPDGQAVAVGRDCGTVVFPEAPVKLYLEAAEAVRLDRRAQQLQRRLGAPADGAMLSAEVGARDRSDAGRATAPMQPATDALVIRTDQVGVEEMVSQALSACARARLLTGGQRPA